MNTQNATDRAAKIKAGKVWQVYPDNDADNILFEGSQSACMLYIREHRLQKEWNCGTIRTGKLIWEAADVAPAASGELSPTI